MKNVYLGLAVLLFTFASCKNLGEDPKTETRHAQLMMVYEELEVFLPVMDGLEKRLRKKRHATQIQSQKEKYLEMNKILDQKILEIKQWKSNYQMPTNLSNKKQLSYMISKQREIELLRKETEETIGEAAKVLTNR